MESVRVFVLALDGLEYRLVWHWKLKSLMQKTYGRTAVTPEYFGGDEHDSPSTPVLWASFITGKPPTQHGVVGWWTYGKTLDLIRRKPPLVWIRHKRKFLRRIQLDPERILKRKMVNKDNLRIATIFDFVEPSIAVDVPAYNSLGKSRIPLFQIFLEQGLEAFEKAAWMIYRERVEKVFGELDKPWRLFMAWFGVSDLMGHIHIARRPRLLRNAYQKLDTLANQLKERTGENTVFLIVSDHGMKPMPDGTGNHSLQAFWSVNIETEWKPTGITDFYGWISRLLSPVGE